MQENNKLIELTEAGVATFISQLKNSPQELYDPIRYFLNIKGKRTRPQLVFIACDLFSGNIKDANPIALAIELFHNFTLIHDDIMDNAPLRRGKSTIHEKWNSNIAILSGDVLLVKAYQQLEDLNSPYKDQITKLFNETAVLVCEGQQMDMTYSASENVSIEEYLQMIKYKTAVLLACSLKSGSICAGAEEWEQNEMYDLGINIGMAFQLKDDWLDLFGDEKKTGKMRGGDVAQNKKTYLLLRMLELANSDDKVSYSVLKTETSKAEKISKVENLYKKYKVGEECEKLIMKYYQNAISNLKKINRSPNDKLLQQIARSIIEREN